jgi:hypothetical protein
MDGAPGLPGSPTDALRLGSEALHPSLERPGDRSYYLAIGSSSNVSGNLLLNL